MEGKEKTGDRRKETQTGNIEVSLHKCEMRWMDLSTILVDNLVCNLWPITFIRRVPLERYQIACFLINFHKQLFSITFREVKPLKMIELKKNHCILVLIVGWETSCVQVRRR